MSSDAKKLAHPPDRYPGIGLEIVFVAQMESITSRNGVLRPLKKLAVLAKNFQQGCLAMTDVKAVWIYINFMVRNFFAGVDMKSPPLSGNNMGYDFSKVISFQKYEPIKTKIFQSI